MGQLLIVRHGRTVWNAQGRIMGHRDVELSEEGRDQALALGRRLARESIDAAYSSDLRRASETAEIVLRDRSIPLCATPQLREYRKGVFEGLTPDETKDRHPDLFAASLVNDLDFAPPDGESIRNASARMAAFAADLKVRHPDDSVLIVSHGGTLRALMVALMELPLEANWRFLVANCSLSMIDTYPNNAVLRLFNDTSHLDGASAGS